MRLAVTGVNGQLVKALVERAPAGFAVMPLGRPMLDLTCPASIGPAIDAANPDVIVSAAAYTAVDKAETDHETAFAVNERGAGAVAAAAAALNVPLIHISTDYVFDGTKSAPYSEVDVPAPKSVYGASKLAGERAVAAANSNHVILRAAWVYSPFGHNFLKTMLRLAAQRDIVGVVADQHGNPTSALDLADVIFAVAGNIVRSNARSLRGVFHASARGDASWARFAEAIFAASGRAGGPTARVDYIKTAQYPTPAPRPANSRLDCTRLATAHGCLLPAWQEALVPVIARLVRKEPKSRHSARNAHWRQ